MHVTQVGRVVATLVDEPGNPYIRLSPLSRLQEATVSHPVSRLCAAPAPAAAMTLAQTELLAPVVMAIADVILAGIGLVARQLARA